MKHAPAQVLRSLFVCGVALAAAGCKGPDSAPRQIPLHIDGQRIAFELQDGPRHEAAEAELRKNAKEVARSLFPGEPMPTVAPPSPAPASVVTVAPVAELPELERPEWADGVAKPPTVVEHDLPRAWPIEVKRGETPALLAKWAGTDARTLFADNEEVLGKRRWLRTTDRLMVTMSANQKVAFDNARDVFQADRLSAYFAKRYFEKVVVYRVKRGEYLSVVAKRYGDVPIWLLEEFNQVNFGALQPGDEILVPVVATYKAGEKNPPAMRVVDEEGRPLADEKRDALAPRLHLDIVGRARLALDDSNVFERGGDSAFNGAGAELLPDYLDVRAAAPSGAAGDPGVPMAPAAATVARDIIVKPGETLLRFVQWGHTSLDAIRAANPQLDPDRIMVGSRLTLPLTDTQYVAFVKARGAWSAEAAAAADVDVDKGGKATHAKGGGKAAKLAGGKAAKPGRTHTVVAGDTAHRIAKRYKTTLRALRQANDRADLEHLRIGQKLSLP